MVVEPIAKADGSREPYSITVSVDEARAVLTEAVTKSEQLPAFNIIYPDLNITTVQVPTAASYGSDMTFIASVGNESLATVFTPFTVGLFARPISQTARRKILIRIGSRLRVIICRVLRATVRLLFRLHNT
jgi:hypothetical protein